MQENKFEDQVQKIMDQLSFDPNDAVWSGVEKEIGKDKKRRKPLFWIFFLSGSLLFGMGYIYLSNNSSIRVTGTKITAHPDTMQEYKPLTDFRKSEIQEKKESNYSSNATLPLTAAIEVPIVRAGSNSVLRHTANTSSRDLKKNSNNGLGNSDYVQGGSNKKQQETLSGLAGTTALAETHFKQIQEPIHGVAKDSMNLVKTHAVPPAKQTNLDSSVSTAVAKNNEKKLSSWKLGFSGTAGISDLNRGSANSGNVYPPLSNTASGGLSYSPLYSYTVKSGFSFSAGVFISHLFSQRVSVSGGLNYHYNSTKVQIDNLSPGQSANFYARAAAVNFGSHSYTNQYHFLELPIWTDLTLNKNKKLPLIWEAGFSFSYMVSSNALFFNPVSNLYYKDIQYFNRAQWNAVTAIMVGLNIQRSQMLVGPQFQYGLTNLNKPGTYPQHFISYGLKVSFIPHRN